MASLVPPSSISLKVQLKRISCGSCVPSLIALTEKANSLAPSYLYLSLSLPAYVSLASCLSRNVLSSSMFHHKTLEKWRTVKPFVSRLSAAITSNSCFSSNVNRNWITKFNGGYQRLPATSLSCVFCVSICLVIGWFCHKKMKCNIV